MAATGKTGRTAKLADVKGLMEYRFVSKNWTPPPEFGHLVWFEFDPVKHAGEYAKWKLDIGNDRAERLKKFSGVEWDFTATCAAAKIAADKARGEARRELERQRNRLPDGARFDVRYDATAIKWEGTLTVVVLDREVTLQDEAPTLFRLLRRLDLRYRAELPENDFHKNGLLPYPAPYYNPPQTQPEEHQP
jgi:hypothetical protein